METATESATVTELSLAAIPLDHSRIVPAEALINQKQVITTRTSVNVTTCLYLSPSNKARSLSTLITVDVRPDTPYKSTLQAQATLGI